MMLRLLAFALAAAVLLLVLAVLVVYAAIEYLPWWGAALFIIAFFGLVLVGVPFAGFRAGKYLLKRAGVGLFKIKGNVLRGATVKVHKVRRLGIEGAGARAGDVASGKAHRYEMHVTITPKFGQGPFQFYDPWELILLPHGRKTNFDTLQDDDEDGCELTDAKIIRSGDPPAGAPPEVVEALRKQRQQMERDRARRQEESEDADATLLLDQGDLNDVDEVQLDLEMESIIREQKSSEETLDVAAVEAEVFEQMTDEPREARRISRDADDADDEEGFAGECFGQSELLLTWLVPANHPRRVKLFYYFNEFGDITLPD